MGENSAIEWTKHTWNPWQGCRKVSAGCENCYMYRDKKRYGQDPTTVIRSSKGTFNLPLKWRDPANVFVCSWSDFFIEDADEWRSEAWEIIKNTPHLTYQLLTKRAQNIADRMPSDWGNGYPNVWLGVTAENQEQADKRIPILLQIPAAVRFVSVEPMLGPVDLTKVKDGFLNLDTLNGFYTGPLGERSPKMPMDNKLDWVICGGESGPGARPMHPDWARSLLDQCQAAGVPCFFKQWGEWEPVYDTGTEFDLSRLSDNDVVMSANGNGIVMRRVGKKAAGRLLDGRTWNQMPEVQP